MAKHRKVHLFDIDIPGRQTFKVGRGFDSHSQRMALLIVRARTHIAAGQTSPRCRVLVPSLTNRSRTRFPPAAT